MHVVGEELHKLSLFPRSIPFDVPSPLLLMKSYSGHDTNAETAQKALDPDNYIAFSLVEKVVLSHDTRMFRFALQSPKHVLGLPIGQHVSMKYVGKDGKMVTRSYTPTSSDHDVSVS